MFEQYRNLIIIGDIECSTTLTYLNYLKLNSIKIKELWLINFTYNKFHTKVKYKTKLKEFFKNNIIKWNPIFNKKIENEFFDLCLKIQNDTNFLKLDFSKKFNYKDVTKNVRSFKFTDYNDTNLIKLINKNSSNAFLYTNGGIVPNKIVGNKEIRIIHLHPGIVPYFKGSDCFLWSALKTKSLGASCFYMNSGIDEGSIIHTKKFNLPKLPSLIPYLNTQLESTAYRALLYSIDPHLRASLLIDVLKQYPDLDLKCLPFNEQKADDGFAYLAMHNKLRLKTMKELFV